MFPSAQLPEWLAHWSFVVDNGGVVRAELTPEFAGMLSEDLLRRFEREQPGLPGGYEREPAGSVARYQGEEASLLFSGVGSSKGTLVDLTGFEPVTSCLPSMRSTN